ncbi:MAG: hopanoid biosynthesis associated radical SAM protein HpnH [Chloroflexi bacterium RBG_16_54_18]|nr:MAG: hopanoid biosynthesis associated radical SAM protein HpnH [Chloroflexi bacterium RBG_16_54_18]
MNTTNIELGMKLMAHVWKNRLAGRKRFPIVTMLEPLEVCNLTCKGCGRIREYRESVIEKKKMLTVEECLRITAEADAPIVSIAGGEPLIHPKIDEIVAGIIAQKRYVFLCSNGILMERAFEKIKPNKHFSWVVHLDGMPEVHDFWVERKGTWDKAMNALKRALNEGYRVCTNTTLFRSSDVNDLHQLFRMLTDLGVEGMMVSAGYPYISTPSQDIYMEREMSIRSFSKALDPTKGFRFYNNPLYLEFLRGERQYPCRAWTNPTYTPLGWRKPCYLLADEHTQDLGELMQDEVWEKYGFGKDPRCASCTMHSGYEAGIIEDSFTRPKAFLDLILSGLTAGRKYRQNGHVEIYEEPGYAVDLEHHPEIPASGDLISLDAIDLVDSKIEE